MPSAHQPTTAGHARSTPLRTSAKATNGASSPTATSPIPAGSANSRRHVALQPGDEKQAADDAVQLDADEPVQRHAADEASHEREARAARSR